MASVAQYPNVLYLHSHDTGRYIQPYGYAVPTPHMQRLAEEGVLYAPATRRDLAAFKASARILDDSYGRILRALDDAGLAEETLVIITTDHGIGVLLVMCGPGGFRGGRVIDALVSHVDIFDLIFDPNEACNLASCPGVRDVLLEMRGRLFRWMEATDDPLLDGPVPAPEGAVVNDPDGLSPSEATRPASTMDTSWLPLK